MHEHLVSNRILGGTADVHVSPYGGTITRFTIDEKPIFYPWHEIDGKARGGNPICAPWFGSSPRAAKKHGHLRDLKAEGVALRLPTHLMLVFQRPGDENYPWPLYYRTGARFQGVGNDEVFEVSLGIERPDDGMESESVAPILPAFHPYFACHDASAIEVCMGGEKHQGFDVQSRSVPLTSKTVLIKMPERVIEMQLGGAFSLDTSRLIFWTDAPNSYACVEPVLGDKQLFDTPEGHALAVGERIDLSMSLKVLQI